MNNAEAVVLGIDAAWTLTRPSGLAIAVKDDRGWRLAACASSYQRFLSLSDTASIAEARALGSRPDAPSLLAAAALIAGAPVALVAIDMPLSLEPINGRRISDNAVSSAYGARKAGTHSPSSIRPGPLSDLLRIQFEESGYPLQTASLAMPGLIEVYPHPALIELASAPERLRYKLQRVSKYWPSHSPLARRELLLAQWRVIVNLLGGRMSGVADLMKIPEASVTVADLKAFEDTLDAVVCCWIGICAIEGDAVAFGDEVSAIWVPKPGAAMT